MAGTLLGVNTTLRVNGAVSATTTSNLASGGNVTIYTAPANGYAIVQLSFNGGTTWTGATIQVGGQDIIFLDSSASIQPIIGTTNRVTPLGAVFIGPSQSLVLTRTGAGSGSITIDVSGVEFINSP